MNLNRLYAILQDTTAQLRKGDVVTKKRVGGLVVVDLTLLSVGVDKAKAETHRTELVSILKEYPAPDRLAGGPSYIEVGGVVGDQGAAFQLFALGKVLGLWDVITPAKMGFTGPEAIDMAGRGLVMISGFRP